MGATRLLRFCDGPSMRASNRRWPLGDGARRRNMASDHDAPHYTNRLINETSPYLLQHAHNPVDWYSWSEEAFIKARQEDKPVLLSVGYSSCHWCHVMERE